MADNKTCPHCGKPVPPTALGDLCPECMLKAGLATQTEGPGGTGEATGPRFVPPPVGEIAKLFPQLEILRLIGQGGMGAVYKARQPALDRFVALKVLPPAAAGDPGFAERFNREARALARLNHPNIVAVHDFGKAGTLHYLVMEFVDGANLREVERLGELTPEQALAIVPQICEALQFAHNEGIVHRDIKPENLLLDKKGRVKITDFGIAKMVGVGAGPQNLTGAKDVVGTPHYMAPEQIEKPLSVDHRADIYSLGVVFYEMLTGELPLGNFQPPSKKVQIDVRLDEVVLHALEKEPDRRYQHASQVKTAVETIVTTPAGGSPANQKEAVTTAAQIEAVRKRLKMPARGLIAAGVLLVLFALGLLVFALPAIASEGGGPAGYAAVCFGAAVLLTAALVVLLGANSMLKLRSYPFSVVASVVAAVAGPGAILGLPFGVWACVELFRPAARAAFAANRQNGDNATPSPGQDQDRSASVGALSFRRGLWAGILCFLLITAVAMIITALMPRDYEGIALVRLAGPEPADPYRLQTEAEIIQSEPVLEPVAASLNLSQRWGQKFAAGEALSDDQTVGLMKRRIDVQPRLNTALVEIRFHSDSPAEAAEIANKIAETYCALPPPPQGIIIEHAMVPSRPVRPNVALNISLGMVAGGILGIFAGILAGLFSFWRGHSEPHELLSATLRSAVESWLAQMDNGDYEQSWDAAAPYFQRAMAKADWIGRLQKVRHPLGPVISRKFASSRFDVSGTRSVVKFATSFDGLLAATETVTFARQAGGEWRAIGYLVRPAGFQERISLGSPMALPATPFSKVFGGIWILIFASYFFLLLNDHFGIHYSTAWDYFNWCFLGFTVVSAAELLVRLRRARNLKPAEELRPLNKSLLKVMLASAVIAFVLAAYFGFLRHHQSSAIKSDYIGQTWFPQGDSIDITSVERSSEKVVVKGHYDLVSHDHALLALYQTTRNKISVPVGSDGRMQISQGRGDFELIDPYLVPGLPHVSMYGADGHPFATVYFGTKDEALEESKAGWITNASSGSALQFRLVLPENSTEPADSLPSASGNDRFQVSRQVLLDDNAIAQAGVDFNRFGGRIIEVRFTDAGAKKFEAITAANIGRQLAIIFRGQVLSAPVIQSVIPGGECQVDGSMSVTEVNEIVDHLNRVATPTAEAWNFSPLHEQILPFNLQPKATVGWLDLDSGGFFLTNPTLDWQSRSGHDWIQARGLDVVTTESAKHFPTLLGIDMIIAPVPTNGWNITTPADVIHNWTLLRKEPRQMQVFGAMPGQSDTFVFQTREGGKGILQILGLADNPPGVKIRYKLVQATQSREAIDVATGLPGGQNNGRIDPNTGLPLPAGATNIAIDPATGLPISLGQTGAIDPANGLPGTPAATKGQ